MSALSTDDDDMLISKRQLGKLLGLSESQIDRLRRKPGSTFPSPISVGAAYTVRWRLGSVREWVRSRPPADFCPPKTAKRKAGAA